MRYLSRPTDENAEPFDAAEVFETCVSMVRNCGLKAQLRSVTSIVEDESKDYEAKAAAGLLFRKLPHTNVGTVAGEQVVKVYTHRMVPKTSTGRPIYDRIMSLPVLGRCPFCGIGTVNTLDHFLPKDRFPVFSVTPVNLVPACKWCQGEKGEYYPTSKGQQLIHPYFDNLEPTIWLSAEVIQDAPAGFRFFASPPECWSASEKERVSTHLKELNLQVLFSSNAGSRLSEIRGRLSGLLQRGGKNAVRAHLQEELTSIEADQTNSWTAAMYRSAVASDWFCEGGFAQT